MKDKVEEISTAIGITGAPAPVKKKSKKKQLSREELAEEIFNYLKEQGIIK